MKLYAISKAMPFLLKGFRYTLLIVGCSIPLAFVVSLLLTLMALSTSRILRMVTTVYVKIFRNIPFMIQVYLMYYAVPAFFGVRVPPLQAGIVALGLYAGCLYFIVIKMGVDSIPKGQFEAAKALRIPYMTTLRRIVFPQIIPIVIPPLINQVVTSIKESSVLSIITVSELTMMANEAIGQTYAPLEVFLTAGIFYWAINLVIEFFGKWVGRRHSGYSRNLAA